MRPSLRLSDAELARLGMLQRSLDAAGDDLTGAIATRNVVLLRQALRHFDQATDHVAALRQSMGDA